MNTPNLDQWAAWFVDSAETDREFSAMLEAVSDNRLQESEVEKQTPTPT